MGMYGEVDIYATFKTEEQAEKVFDSLEDNVKKHIESKLDTPYHLMFSECDLDGTCIIIKICSDRYQNAEWQGQQILDYMKTTEGLVEFTGDITMPDNYLFWNEGDD